MQDPECIAFLQWALPRLRMRWAGYRKVRGQVCKRVARRIASLGLADTFAYHVYLETHPDEWKQLDELCPVPISCFYRDRAVFEYLEQKVLPILARAAAARGSDRIQVWSAGCGAGEEPYTFAIMWRCSLQQQFRDLKLQILATDIDRDQLDRAVVACYPRGSMKQLPESWIEGAFEKSIGRCCLRPEFRTSVEFQLQDIRCQLRDRIFDLVLCRNLAFTYFEEELQREIARSLRDHVRPGGVLVLGIHEVLPPGTEGFCSLQPRLHIYQRDPDSVVTPFMKKVCEAMLHRLHYKKQRSAGSIHE
jgi:chemotaxis protein methyltransferase CheR